MHSITKPRGYLKWDNNIIGVIDYNDTVTFYAPHYNNVVSLYTNGTSLWTSRQFQTFLHKRVFSRNRRDIEQLLFYCGMSSYDVLRIAGITRGIHPRDLFWIANSEDEKMDHVKSEVFLSIFHHKTDLTGSGVDTPEGNNVKRYGAFSGNYGIYKQRISPVITDVESEVSVHLLAKKLGLPCCKAARTDENTIFSTFDSSVWPFGSNGAYWNDIYAIARERGSLSGLLNLDIAESDVAAILLEAGFVGYRYNGALRWILKSIDMIRTLY